MSDEVRTAAGCTCTELNRRLMASLLRVGEGEVHEDGCRARAYEQGRREALDAALAAVEGLHPHRKTWPIMRGQDREADGYRHWCGTCRVTWPCRTIQVLTELREGTR